MRQAFLFFLVFLAGCALPRPTSWRPKPSFLVGAQGSLAYEIQSPKGNLEGKAYFLAGPAFFYFEVLNPFGLAEAQGILEGKEAKLLLFGSRQLIRFRLGEIGGLSCCWGSLILGRFPRSFLQDALVLEQKRGYTLRKDFSSLYVLAFFNREGQLLEVKIKGEKTNLKITYHPTGKITEIYLPSLRTRVRLKFLALKERPLLKAPLIEKPIGFKEVIYKLE